MNFFKRLFPGGSVSRGIAAIAVGTAGGQIVVVLGSPILSRLYRPEDFAALTVITSIAMILGTVLALRFEMTIPLPPEDDHGRALVFGSAMVAAAIAAVLTVVLWIFRVEIADALRQEKLAFWMPWLPTIALTLTIFRILNQWALRQKRYSATARRNFLQSFSTVAIQVVAGLKGLGPAGLIGGFAGGQTVGAVSLLLQRGLFSKISFESIKSQLGRHLRFATLLTPAGLLNSMGGYIPVILVSTLFGATAAGHFGFTQRIIALPIALVGQVVAQVYLSELASKKRSNDAGIRKMFWVATTRLATVAAAIALVLLAFGPSLFTLVFGDQWEQAGKVAQALAPYLFAQLVASPVSQTLIVFRRSGLQLTWDAGRLVIACATIVVPWSFGLGLVATVWIFSLGGLLSYAVSWDLSRRQIERR